MPECSSPAGVCPVSAVAGRPVNWLWPGRLALGKLALLEGDPGLGKSLVALDLCARISRGDGFPDGGTGTGPGNCLVLNAEDGQADTIRPRLEALGADLNRVFIMSRQLVGGEGVRLPGELEVLDEAVQQARAVLVVIDPLLAFLDAKAASGNDQAVRQALHPLARLAERHNCVPLMVRHLNKYGGKQALYRGGGAIGVVGACRSAWLVGRDPDDAGRCVLAQVKNNLAGRQPSLAYTVAPQETGPPRLNWLGLTSWSADQLLVSWSRGRRRARAREFLQTLLQPGPQPVRVVWEEARKQGLAERTLKRARQDLHVRSVRVDLPGQHQNYWLLPGQQVPGELAGHAGEDDLEPWLAPLRQQSAQRTPLDEE